MEINQTDKPKEFTKLFLASFISQSGSYFMTLSLAGLTYAITGSIIISALILVFSYLPAVFLSSQIGHRIDHKLSIRMLLMLEAASATVSIICGVLIYSELYAFLLIPLCFRAFLTFATRAAMSKWVKIISPDEKQEVRIKLFLLGFLLSTTVAGILTGLVLGNYNDVERLRQEIITNVVLIDVATYILSISIIFFLDKPHETVGNLQKQAEERNDSSESEGLNTLRQLFQNQTLKRTFLAVIFSQALFQGAYQSLISVLPSSLGLKINGISGFQISASLGLIVAFIVLWLDPDFLQEKKLFVPIKTIITSLAGGLALIIVVSSSSFLISILSFGSLTFFYELIWLANRSSFFVKAPVESIARYQFLLDAIAATLMSLCTIGYAIFMELFGIQVGAIIFLIIASSIFSITSILLNHQKKIIVNVINKKA